MEILLTKNGWKWNNWGFFGMSKFLIINQIPGKKSNPRKLTLLFTITFVRKETVMTLKNRTRDYYISAKSRSESKWIIQNDFALKFSQNFQNVQNPI